MQTTEATSDTPTIEMRIDRGLADVEPDCAELLHPLLIYDHTSFLAGPNSRLQRQTRSVPLYRQLQCGVTRIPAGCVPRVKRSLERLGHEVVVRDSRPLRTEKYKIDEQSLREVESPPPGLSRVLTEQLEGVIEVTRGPKRNRLIGAICRLFPKARIFVACATIAHTNEVAGALGPYMGGEVQAVHGANWRSPYRVVCGTYRSLSSSDPADRDIVLFEDANEAQGKANWDGRAMYGRHRIYAFADPDDNRSAKTELLFEILAGPVIYRDALTRRSSSLALTVAFAHYSSPCRKQKKAGRDRREALWADSHRNQAIAEVARAFKAGDESALWEHGMFLEGRPDWLTFSPPPGVLVVVESVAHGKRLARLLPGWSFIHGGHGQGTINHSHSSGWGVPQNLIVTTVAAEKCKQFNAQVLIMATGGTWPQIPKSVARTRGPRLLVDFSDESNPSLAAETRERLKTYRSLGYPILGASPDHGPEGATSTSGRRGSTRRQPNTSRRRNRRHRQ